MRSLTFTETIGAGAFGTVYKADLTSDQGFRRTVAVKIVLESHAEKEMFITRMRDEARLLGLLQDDHILKVIDLLQVNERDAIVMEYIKGVDLSQAVNEKKLPPFRAVMEIGAMVAGTLDRAHQARHPESNEHLGVVHRDVKPANVMLTASGNLKLLDFGIAQAKFAARESQTGQMVLGTLNYMAPDYVITGEVTPAIDVYGIGLTLFELVTGEVFGQPKLREDQHNQRLQERMPIVASQNEDLAHLLSKMLHWEPEARPNCRDVERALSVLADEMRGPGLRRYCAEVVPDILQSRSQAPDTERLLGKTISMAEPELPYAEAATVDSVIDEPHIAPETPEPDAPTEENDNAPIETKDLASIEEDDNAPTMIEPRAQLQQSLEPSTGETALPRADPEPLDQKPKPIEKSVKVSTVDAAPHQPPPRITATQRAIFRGLAIGGSVGALAVALLAIVLFSWFPPVSSP